MLNTNSNSQLLKEETNHTIFLRPRFSFDIALDAASGVKRIEDYVRGAERSYKIKVVDFHIFMDVPDKYAHFWSPQLHIELIDREEGGATVKGLFGPKPNVWTLFMFLHFIVGGAFISFVAMLYIRHSLDQSMAFPLIMTIALPIVWALLYVLGRLGRDTGKKQMKELHNLLLASLSLNQ